MSLTLSGKSAPTDRYPTLCAKAARSSADSLAGCSAGTDGGGTTAATASQTCLRASCLLDDACAQVTTLSGGSSYPRPTTTQCTSH